MRSSPQKAHFACLERFFPGLCISSPIGLFRVFFNIDKLEQANYTSDTHPPWGGYLKERLRWKEKTLCAV